MLGCIWKEGASGDGVKRYEESEGTCDDRKDEGKYDWWEKEWMLEWCGLYEGAVWSHG